MMMSQSLSLQRSREFVLRSLLWLTLAFCALMASANAWADPPGRVGRIADTQGTVWLYDDDQGEWIQAVRNRPVTDGDRISAERGARATVQIGATTLRIDGGTDLELAQLDDQRVRVRLHAGSVALRVRSGREGDRAREFSVATNEGSYTPLRPGRYRIDTRNDGSSGAALDGALQFEARDSVLDLNAGQRAEFWVEGGVTHYAWAEMPNDRFGDWVAGEDRRDDRERDRNRYYVSPEMTGADDLDRYGNWDRHPEYGTIWYPTTVAVGWSPYRYGHWAYVSPWGYTWVDDAPWGFAPFHYGRWVNYGGRWGWCPGQYVARPVYAPALVGWFGGSNVSVGISVGGGPAVGWVPLAPREVYRPTYNVTNIYVTNVNRPYERWQPPQRAVPTGPIMYTNQGVAGGVTVVPQGVMRGRQPVSNAVVPVDHNVVARWTAPAQPSVPVAPPQRVVSVPGGAAPAAPGDNRGTRWESRGRFEGQRNLDRGNERGRDAPPTQAARIDPRPPQQVQAAPQASVQPAPPAAVQRPRPQAPSQQAVQRDQNPPRVERDNNVNRSDRNELMRDAAPNRRAPVQQPAAPTAQPAQVPQAARPAPPPQVQQQVQPAPGQAALPPPHQQQPRVHREERTGQQVERGGDRGAHDEGRRGEPREQQNR